MVQVLTSCIVQANPPKWKREELLRMAFSATSVCLMLLSGKNMQSSSDVHVHSVGVNTLVLVKQLVFLTAVPGRVRTNYESMWVVKCSVFP